jgi:hypothetical protein
MIGYNVQIINGTIKTNMTNRVFKYRGILFRTLYTDYWGGYIATPFGLVKMSEVEHLNREELSMSYREYMELDAYK